MIERLKFATGNKNKLREAREILGFEIEQVEVELDEIQTIKIEELILHKAKQAYELKGEPIVVEDTGLFLEAWNGLPGALVKWFLESVGSQGILDMLNTSENRSATAKCIVAMFDGKELITGIGEVTGSIAIEKRGDNGFGWDVIFIPGGHDKTYAELGEEYKNGISHRKLAFENFKSNLLRLGGSMR